MHLGETIPQLETRESESVLSQIHEFNVQEKSKNLKDLAANGIDKMKSIFQRLNIKKAIKSFFKKEDENEFEPIDNNNEDISESKIELNEKIEQEVGPKVLLEFDTLNISSIKSDIYTYYKENHTGNIRKAIVAKYPEIPQNKIDIAVNRAITQLSEKPVKEFKSKIATQLEAHDIFKEDFAKFWQWRLKNLPPTAHAKFVHTDTGNKLQYENFISDAVVSKFLDQHTSTLPDEFFDEIDEKDQSIHQPIKTPEPTPTALEDLEGVDNLDDLGNRPVYTSEDIDNVFTKELNEFTQSDPTLTEADFINTLTNQSNGWINTQMYDNISNISTKDALIMLGNINSELKPFTRTALSDMHNTMSDETIPFGTFLHNYLTNDSIFSKKDIHIASDIITKLDKTVTLSKQK